MNNPIRKNDVYLIIGFIAVFCVILAAIHFTGESGTTVQVSVDGVVRSSYPIDKEITTIIEGYNGGRNTLVIEDGYAYLKDTSCPDHLCEKMGKINTAGQSVICLPNRVVVEIIGDDSLSEYDTLVGG